MGLSALTRNGWKKNPLKQGSWNLKVSIGVSIIIPLIGFLIGNETMAGSIVVAPFVLLWGVTSYFLGVWQDKLNKKANEENQNKKI